MSEDSALTDSLWQGAAEAFESMVMIPIERLQDSGELGSDNSIVGSITFTGAIEGALLILCDMDSAANISKGMLMMEADEEISQDEIKDSIGEVTNLVIGGFKSRIADTVGNIDISVPTVICGKKVRPALGKDAQKAEVRATGEGCNIHLELIYKGK